MQDQWHVDAGACRRRHANEIAQTDMFQPAHRRAQHDRCAGPLRSVGNGLDCLKMMRVEHAYGPAFVECPTNPVSGVVSDHGLPSAINAAPRRLPSFTALTTMFG